MSPLLKDAQRCARWQFEVQAAPCGALELYQTQAGFVWNWAAKPEHLVPLVGVLDDASADPKKAFCFSEFDAAIDHLMSCAGHAFFGRCALTECH